jgi:hypothetical protein
VKTSATPLLWTLRFALLYVLFIGLFILGTLPLAGLMPGDETSEPGLLGAGSGLLVIAAVNVFVVAAMVLTSRWSGWRLALCLALAYYGAVTFLMQIETWYFLTSLTVDARLLPRLFLMGVPPAFVFVPLAVWILGRGGGAPEGQSERPFDRPAVGWIRSFALIAVAYVALYWTAGYFIAWQNPELRSFYGQPGDAAPFFAHSFQTLRTDPWLLPFQLLRGMLWGACALPIVLGSRVDAWWTALLVGTFFSLPQNVGHVIANPLIPLASVRLSHMIETIVSNFLFGLVVVWLFHRESRQAT